MSSKFYIAVPKFSKKLGMMGFHAAVSAFVVLVFAGLCLCEKREEGLASSQREFDYFLLALQWPATVCQGTTHCCPSNGCCRSTGSSGFTIHGLWTNYNNGTWPACCTTAQFDIKEVKPLLKGLKKYWPSLTCSSWPTCHNVKGLFWAHEWEKHGTCSSPIFQDEYNYFLATLNLYLKYNVTEILRKEGYMPSNSEKYPLGGIVSAVQNAVRATPKLVCSDGAIQELYLCFYKNFEPRDCVDSLSKEATGNTSTSCPRYISLPEYRPWSPEGITSILHSSNNEDA